MRPLHLLLLRGSLAVIFVWFGLLKVCALCPLGEFVTATIFFLPATLSLCVLGWWEVAIGLCFLWRPLVRFGVAMMLVHMCGTMLPLVIQPENCFTQFPLGLTLEGQYIVKNLCLVSAALVVKSSLPADNDAGWPRPWKPECN
ncbi:MAG: hypothetical protein AB7K24_03555 [Gemmataceae bacterium]